MGNSPSQQQQQQQQKKTPQAIQQKQKRQEIIEKALKKQKIQNQVILQQHDRHLTAAQKRKLADLPKPVVQKVVDSLQDMDKKCAEYRKKLVANVIQDAQQQGNIKTPQKKLESLSPQKKQQVQQKLQQLHKQTQKKQSQQKKSAPQ